MLQVT